MSDLLWTDTFDYLPPNGKRYRKVKLEADANVVRIKLGKEVITLVPCNDFAFLQRVQRAVEAQRALGHIARPDTRVG